MVQEGWSCNVLPTGQVFIIPYELRGDLFVRLSDIMAEKIIHQQKEKQFQPNKSEMLIILQ